MTVLEDARVESVLDTPEFKIAAARRILHREGLDSQIGGHVSLRVPGEEAFWVTPLQYFDETLPEHVAKVGFGLEVLQPGTIALSPAIGFHSSIYRAREDANCVVHVHARNGAVLSTTGVPFGMYYSYASLFIDDVAYCQDTPGLTPISEGDLFASALGPHRALLMRHHGAIHVADSLEGAVVETIVFEMCCGMQLAAMAVGGVEQDRETALGYRDGYRDVGFRQQMWDANFRRLRRSDPDLFASLSLA